MDTNLAFAEKYNWWTKNTKDISLETKLSYILSQGTPEELFFVFRNFETESLQKAFGKIQHDSFVLKARRKGAITQLLQYKKNNIL